MVRRRSHLFLLFFLLIPSLGPAQEQPKPQSESEQIAQAKAVEILNAIAEGIPGLRSSENRIFLTGAVADLLWVNDEKHARSLFEALAKEINAPMSTLDPTDPHSINTLMGIYQQRREIIDRMGRRDPEMALSFLRATRPPAGLTALNNEQSNDTNLELHLAGMLAQKDPEQALRMARAGLSRGVSYSLVSVLLQIAGTNPEAARTFHNELVEKIKSADLVNNYDVANAAWNLLISFQPPKANEDSYRSLTELMASAVLSVKPDVRNGNSMAQNFHNQVPSLMPQFEKYSPARVTALRQWSQQIKRTIDPGSRVYHEINDVVQKGTIDEILGLTSKYGPEHHSHIYQQASNKAVSVGDVNRARQIITEFITDGQQRRQMLEQLDNQLFWTTVGENKIAEARQVMERVQGAEQRFHLLIGLAMNLANRGEKKQATSLLAEAATLLEAFPPNSARLGAQLQLAQSYSTVDSQQTVALLQSVIALVNQLVAAAAVLDGFENSYLKDGEWMKRGYSNLGNLVNNIEQNLGTLARVDAESARSLSNQFERPEIRLMAQLEIAKTLLGGPGANFGNYTRIINSYPMRRRK